jgi:hypothetical protein
MRAALLLGTLIVGAHVYAQTPAQPRYVCKDFVERQLHDPRGAKLEWTDGTVARNSDGTWRVQFRGRVRNQMGGMTLSNFECIVRHTGGDNFSAVKVRAF